MKILLVLIGTTVFILSACQKSKRDITPDETTSHAIQSSHSTPLIAVPSSRELAEQFDRMMKDSAAQDKKYRRALAQYSESIKSLDSHRKIEAQEIAEMNAKMSSIGPHPGVATQQSVETQSSADFDQRVALSKERAIQRYPDAGKPGSAISEKMNEIADRLQAEGNQLVYQPESPERIADMAAGALGISPVQ